MKKITLVAFDKFTDIDVFLAWDLFNRVALKNKDWSVKIVGTSQRHVSVTGIPIPTHGIIEMCNTADVVFFASGPGTRTLMNTADVVFFASGPGTRTLMKDESYLKRFQLNPEKQIICSMCSGSLILGALGLLNGITATTYPTAIKELQGLGVTFEDKPLVVHGNIATAAGCLAGVDLVAWVIEKLLGAEASEEVIASVQPIGKGLECIY